MAASCICHSAICGSWARNQRKANCTCGNAARRATSWMEGATSTVSGREPGAMRAKQPYYNGGACGAERDHSLAALRGCLAEGLDGDAGYQLCGAGALARERFLRN